MFLLAPLLFGLVTASIPVVIHLLHRQRTVPVQWGAMQFLVASALQQKKRKYVEHWLLMIVRILALALLVLALARPLWITGKYNPLASTEACDIAIVLDHSLSMGRHAGSQTLFEQGLDAVDKTSSLMRTGDTLSIVLGEHAPRAVNAGPVAAKDAAAVCRRLRDLKPGLTDCSIPEAVQAARDLVNKGRNVRKLILIVSDQQRTNWHIDEELAWRLPSWQAEAVARNFSIHDLPLTADADASNISVGNIAMEPALVGAGRPAQITATLSNSGPKDVGGIVARLTVSGKDADSKTVGTLGAGQSATVRFDRTFASPGSDWIRVRTDVVDSLAADNEAVASALVWQNLPVLIIDGQLAGSGFKASRFLRAAMQPVETAQEKQTLIQPTVVGVGDCLAKRLEDYFVVVVNDCPQLPPGMAEKLTDYARGGHGLWFILGPRTRNVLPADQLNHSELFWSDVNGSKTAPAPMTVEVRDSANPMVAVIAASERNALSGAVLQQWWSLRPKNSDAVVVVATTSGDALIAERPLGRNGGRIVVWTTGADATWNNLPLMPNFVPLVNETIYHLCGGQTKGMENRELEAGEPIVWTGPASPPVSSVELTLPDGTTAAGRKPTLTNGRYEFRYNNAFLPGLYTMQFSPPTVRPVYFGVGIDRRELDTEILSNRDIDWLRGNGYLDEERAKIAVDDLSIVIRKENPGTDLWKWLACAVLLMLLLETLITYRMSGYQIVRSAGFSPSGS